MQPSSSRADTTWWQLRLLPESIVVTGEGLREALTGANVVVDVTNSPSFEDNAVLDFFRSSTGHLLSAAAAAGVSHYVALSVVGLDRIRDSGYLRAKHAQEGMIEAGGVPYTVLRATQFFEFLKAIADGGTEGNVVHLSPSKFQPVAADDVAATLAEIATGQPKNGVVELAGPDALSMAEFIQSFLLSVGDKRKVVPDHDAKYFGAVLDKDGGSPPKDNSLLDGYALPIGYAPNSEPLVKRRPHFEEDRLAAACGRLTVSDKCGQRLGNECSALQSDANL